jgi:hypothetical protein
MTIKGTLLDRYNNVLKYNNVTKMQGPMPKNTMKNVDHEAGGR